MSPAQGRHAVDKGCPFDCGPCESHTQKVRLPVVTITSACNLDCPICYVHNKNDDAYHMSVGEFDRILAHLREEHGAELDIVNLTGGEPFMHPRLWDFLEHAQAAGIHRVTVCSNGLKLAKDEAVVERLSALGARVALSFDTFDAEADFALQGAHLVATKLRTEAEAMKAEYEQNLQNARTEANEIVANAQKTATARGEEIVGEARAQAAALKQKAEADIAQERKKAVNEVKDEIGGIAMEIASKVVEREISEKDHKDLIDEFIKNVGEAS